jgi:hypothetical protein
MIDRYELAAAIICAALALYDLSDEVVPFGALLLVMFGMMIALAYLSGGYDR